MADFRFPEPVAPLDDAYIHAQIARNLHDHGVWGFNPNEPTAASSAPLFTSLLALTPTIPSECGWIVRGRWLGIAFHVGLLVLMGHVAGATSRRRGWGGQSILVTCAILQGMALWAANSGMEIMLAALLMAILVRPRARMGARRRSPGWVAIAGFGLTFGLLMLTRLDLALVVGALLVVDLCAQIKPTLDGSLLSIRRPPAAAWLAGTVAMVVIGVYLVLCAGLAISPLPNPMRVKTGYHGVVVVADYLRDAIFILIRYQPVIGLLGLWGCALQARDWVRGQAHASTAFFLPAVLLANAILNPHLYNHGRYLMPMLLLVVFPAGRALRELTSWPRRFTLYLQLGGRRIGTIPIPHSLLISAVLFAAAACTVYSMRSWSNRFADDQDGVILNHGAASAFLLQLLPRQARIATHDIGYLGHVGGFRVLDLAGLASNPLMELNRNPNLDASTMLVDLFESQDISAVVTFPAYHMLPDLTYLRKAFAPPKRIGYFDIRVRVSAIPTASSPAD